MCSVQPTNADNVSISSVLPSAEAIGPTAVNHTPIAITNQNAISNVLLDNSAASSNVVAVCIPENSFPVAVTNIVSLNSQVGSGNPSAVNSQAMPTLAKPGWFTEKTEVLSQGISIMKP